MCIHVHHSPPYLERLDICFFSNCGLESTNGRTGGLTTPYRATAAPNGEGSLPYRLYLSYPTRRFVLSLSRLEPTAA